MITGNKGEWSEVYTHLKLLADGALYSGDKDLNLLEDIYFEILKIFRNEPEHGKYVYQINKLQKRIKITDEDANELVISQEKLANMAKSLYDKIKAAKGERAFALPEIEESMEEVKMYHLKAPASEKADIRMVIHDIHTEMNAQLGFSIKSQLGGNSTLFNPSHSTNFIYELSGDDLDENAVQAINRIDGFEKKFDKIEELGIRVAYAKMASSTFFNNLTYIDASLPRILGEALILHYSHAIGTSALSRITKDIAIKNPCQFDLSSGMDFYEHKMKQFLLTVALGMTAAKVWDGKYQANGGYIVVKEDGNIVCYHFYERNQLEDYLFYYTTFETPSRSRYGYSDIYEENGKFYMKLCLQVRFI